MGQTCSVRVNTGKISQKQVELTQNLLLPRLGFDWEKTKPITNYTSPATHVTCHLSYVMCHVMCHMSHYFSFFLLLLYKEVKVIGGGSVINGVYPV